VQRVVLLVDWPTIKAGRVGFFHGCGLRSLRNDSDAVEGWISGGLFQPGHDDWRCIATTVNRMPAAALYLRTPDTPDHRLFAIAVLHVVHGKTAELMMLGRPDSRSSRRMAG